MCASLRMNGCLAAIQDVTYGLSMVADDHRGRRGGRVTSGIRDPRWSELRAVPSGISITGYEVDFANPTLLLEPPHILIGSADYNVANDPNNTIWQLVDVPALPTPPTLYSAAVAVIDVSAAGLNAYTAPESLVNVVLKVTRKGRDLRDHSVNYDVMLSGTTANPYNVPVVNTLGTDATTLTLKGTSPTDPDGVVGLYMPLPDPKFDLGAGVTYLVPPDDGSPPDSDQLQSAVNAILAEDPTGKANPQT